MGYLLKVTQYFDSCQGIFGIIIRRYQATACYVYSMARFLPSYEAVIAVESWQSRTVIAVEAWRQPGLIPRSGVVVLFIGVCVRLLPDRGTRSSLPGGSPGLGRDDFVVERPR